MLLNHHLRHDRKKPANKKKFVNKWLEDMPFKDFIKREVDEGGITDFYDMTSDAQCMAISKYFLELDDLDAADIFYIRNMENDLIAEIRKVIKGSVEQSKFFSWLRKTVYETSLPKVQRAIQEAVEDKKPFAGSDAEQRCEL